MKTTGSDNAVVWDFTGQLIFEQDTGKRFLILLPPCLHIIAIDDILERSMPGDEIHITLTHKTPHRILGGK